MGLELGNIIIIVAASSNNVIGDKNKLIWNLPSDLKMFKKVTSGHVVIMGRRTWESIPNKHRPLPNRTNVVLSRNPDYIANGAYVRPNLVESLEEFTRQGKDVFVIGGGEIYKEAFKYANKLYMTRVVANVVGDTYLEGLVNSDWDLVEFEGPFKEDGLDFRFEKYRKNGENS